MNENITMNLAILKRFHMKYDDSNQEKYENTKNAMRHLTEQIIIALKNAFKGNEEAEKALQPLIDDFVGAVEGCITDGFIVAMGIGNHGLHVEYFYGDCRDIKMYAFPFCYFHGPQLDKEINDSTLNVK